LAEAAACKCLKRLRRVSNFAENVVTDMSHINADCC
jgi:hypothetical protein